MTAEIIAVGSELLTPQRVDTNSLFLTQRLNERGIEVVRKTIVGDDRERLADEIRQARGSSQVVIMTGGLGPTLDDISREAASDALGREMVFHPEILENIEALFRSFKRKMADINRRQAYILEGAEVLHNDNGTAPGQWFEDDDGILVLLPGPPRELEPLFEQQCIPRLERLESPYEYHTVSLRVVGVSESEVDQRIAPIYTAESRVATTILSAPGDIQIHLRAQASTAEEARKIAASLGDKVEVELGEAIYTREGETLEQVVARLYCGSGTTLAVAESCTGGLLAQRITSVPGSSEYFAGGYITYSDGAKTAWLGVDAATIEKRGAVSRETAAEMARAVRQKAGASVGVSITGVAGPTGATEETPVGTVFVGIADDASVEVKQLHLGGNRHRVRVLAAQTALDLLRRRVG